MSDGKDIINVRIRLPRNIHKRLKAEAAERETTLEGLIVEILKKHVMRGSGGGGQNI